MCTKDNWRSEPRGPTRKQGTLDETRPAQDEPARPARDAPKAQAPAIRRRVKARSQGPKVQKAPDNIDDDSLAIAPVAAPSRAFGIKIHSRGGAAAGGWPRQPPGRTQPSDIPMSTLLAWDSSAPAPDLSGSDDSQDGADAVSRGHPRLAHASGPTPRPHGKSPGPDRARDAGTASTAPQEQAARDAPLPSDAALSPRPGAGPGDVDTGGDAAAAWLRKLLQDRDKLRRERQGDGVPEGGGRRGPDPREPAPSDGPRTAGVGAASGPVRDATAAAAYTAAPAATAEARDDMAFPAELFRGFGPEPSTAAPDAHAGRGSDCAEAASGRAPSPPRAPRAACAAEGSGGDGPRARPSVGAGTAPECLRPGAGGPSAAAPPPSDAPRPAPPASPADHPLLRHHCHKIAGLREWVTTALAHWHVCVAFLCGPPGAGKSLWAEKLRQSHGAAVHVLTHEQHPALYCLEEGRVVFLPRRCGGAALDYAMFSRLALDDVTRRGGELIRGASPGRPTVLLYDDSNLLPEDYAPTAARALQSGVPVSNIAWFVADEGVPEDDEVQRLLVKSHRRHQRFLTQQRQGLQPNPVAGREVDAAQIRRAVRQLRTTYYAPRMAAGKQLLCTLDLLTDFSRRLRALCGEVEADELDPWTALDEVDDRLFPLPSKTLVASGAPCRSRRAPPMHIPTTTSSPPPRSAGPQAFAPGVRYESFPEVITDHPKWSMSWP